MSDYIILREWLFFHIIYVSDTEMKRCSALWEVALILKVIVNVTKILTILLLAVANQVTTTKNKKNKK